MIPLSDPDLHRRTTPYVTIGLLTVNILAFFYQLILSDLDLFTFTYKFGAISAELTGQGALGPVSVAFPEGIYQVDVTSPVPTWATMFTSMFMHGGFMHLAGNMLFLWVFGDNIEDRFGHLRYLAFYLAGGVAAVWAQTLVDTSSTTPLIGASGAIAAVLGAYILLYPHSRISTLVVLGFIFATRVPAVVLLGFWVLLQAFSGIGSLGAPASSGGVAYFAHLGGFAVGVCVVIAYRLVRREPSRPPPSP